MMRNDMKCLSEQLQEYVHQTRLLEEDMRQETETKSDLLGRSVYTARILEIVKNVRKQDADIVKVEVPLSLLSCRPIF
jgi:hypothetical protein